MPVSGFTEELKQRCRDRCAYPYGEPPCWQLPELSSDAEHEDIRPCRECINNEPNE